MDIVCARRLVALQACDIREPSVQVLLCHDSELLACCVPAACQAHLHGPSLWADKQVILQADSEISTFHGDMYVCRDLIKCKWRVYQ